MSGRPASHVPARGSPPSLLLGATAFCSLLLGCAAPLVVEREIDPLAILGPGALVYARLDGVAARSLAPAMLPPDQGKALAPLLKRTESMAFAIGARDSAGPAADKAKPGGAEAVRPDGDPKGGALPALDAVFLGDYPFRAASLVLGSQPGWRREGQAFANAATGIRAAVPGPAVMLASTGDYDDLLARVKTPPGSPIPRRLEALSSKELMVWVPEPFKRLAALFVGESMGIPARGLLVSATRKPGAPGAEAVYVVTVAFAMTDANSARIFRPAFRLAWYLIARTLLTEEADAALALHFSLDGELYWATGLELHASTLAASLGRLRGSMGTP
ncbi:MAG TPA: hypothetical protein VFL04_02805 [Rectinemataceae bacterium]|nr:hypothetical protein [Rectinemataceae bacterium]